MACLTGTPPGVWLADERALATAVQVLEQLYGKRQGNGVISGSAEGGDGG